MQYAYCVSMEIDSFKYILFLILAWRPIIISENMCIKQLLKVERSTTSPYIHTSDSYFSKGRHNPSVPFT